VSPGVVVAVDAHALRFYIVNATILARVTHVIAATIAAVNNICWSRGAMFALILIARKT
jgi:hypothetical protein